MSELETRTAVEQLIEAIDGARREELKSKIRTPSKQPYLYLSGLHSCTRNLFYRLTEGDKQAPPDEYLQELFDAGNDQESSIKRKLLSWGFELIKSQERVEIPYQGQIQALRGEIIGVGKIDGAVRFKPATGSIVEIPAEIKAMDPNKWRRIRDGVQGAEDLLSIDEFTERYMRQLLCYLYAKNLEQGFFIITDFKGHLKMIPVFLGNHLEVAELALRGMEKAFEAVKKAEAPDRISFHPRVCGRCAFNPICLPGEVIGGSDAFDDPELEAALERHEELAPLAKEYEKIHDNVKALFKDKPTTTISAHFQITVSKQMRSRLNKDLLDAEAVKAATERFEVQSVKVKDLLVPGK